MVLSLPLAAAIGLSPAVRAELEVVINSLDQKPTEKLAAVWEPRRKLDADLKRTVKKELIDLLYKRRAAYEPIATSLEDARAGDVAALQAVIEHVAPIKDLKSLLAKWDKNFKPAPTTRSGLVTRLSELLNGAAPVEHAPKRARPR
jgi:hypothetical protein